MTFIALVLRKVTRSTLQLVVGGGVAASPGARHRGGQCCSPPRWATLLLSKPTCVKQAHWYVGKPEARGQHTKWSSTPSPPGSAVPEGLEEHRGRAGSSCSGDTAGASWGHWEGSCRLGDGLHLRSCSGHPLPALLFAAKNTYRG